MACVLTNGLTRECQHSFGGLKKLYLLNYDDVEVVDYDETNGSITGVTLTSGATMYEIEFSKDTAQVLEELQKDGASSFINQTVNFQVSNITQEKKEVLNALSLATMCAIVQKSDNNYWFVGEPSHSRGLEAETGTNDTGTAQTDAATATFSLVGASTDYANMVESTVVDTLLTT